MPCTSKITTLYILLSESENGGMQAKLTCSRKGVDLDHIVAADIVTDDLKLLVRDAREPLRFQQLTPLIIGDLIFVKKAI